MKRLLPVILDYLYEFVYKKDKHIMFSALRSLFTMTAPSKYGDNIVKHAYESRFYEFIEVLNDSDTPLNFYLQDFEDSFKTHKFIEIQRNINNLEYFSKEFNTKTVSCYKLYRLAIMEINHKRASDLEYIIFLTIFKKHHSSINELVSLLKTLREPKLRYIAWELHSDILSKNADSIEEHWDILLQSKEDLAFYLFKKIEINQVFPNSKNDE